MKHYTFILLTLITLVLLLSFSNDTVKFNPLTNECNSISQGDWGNWRETDCFKGLYFRVKNRGKNYDGTKYKWSVQFRNRYYDKIHFNYEVYDNKPSSPSTSNRLSLEYNQESDGYRDFYMNNGSSIYVYVDKVRFVKDGFQDYSPCDK